MGPSSRPSPPPSPSALWFKWLKKKKPVQMWWNTWAKKWIYIRGKKSTYSSLYLTHILRNWQVSFSCIDFAADANLCQFHKVHYAEWIFTHTQKKLKAVIPELGDLFLFKSAFTVPHEVYNFNEMKREAFQDQLKDFVALWVTLTAWVNNLAISTSESTHSWKT